MALLTILKEPDPRLRQVSKAIPFQTNVGSLVQDMVETMIHSQGIGLAAPQVNVQERLLIMKASSTLYVMINPMLTWTSSDQNKYEEGCLSIPEYYESVSRPSRIKVRYFDQYWKEHEQEFSGLEATCIQHEMDHLDGILFIDHLSWLKKSLFQKKQQRFAEANIS